MPFKSKKQRKFMFAKKPEVAEEFAKETPKGKVVPEKVNSKKSMIVAMKKGRRK